ncbi:hypothetical protein Ancab_026197 [Ancistrocladus abbreviatus]
MPDVSVTKNPTSYRRNTNNRGGCQTTPLRARTHRAYLHVLDTISSPKANHLLYLLITLQNRTLKLPCSNMLQPVPILIFDRSIGKIQTENHIQSTRITTFHLLGSQSCKSIAKVG